MTTSTGQPTQVQQLYENAAAIYDRYNKDTTTSVARFMLSLAPMPDAESIILDNACGTGALTSSLLESLRASQEEAGPDSPVGISAYPKIHAVDVSPAMVASVVRKSEHFQIPPGSLQTGVMDAQALAFPDHAFTHSYLNFGIFFLPDPARGVAEIYRTLKPGGAAFISTWVSLGYLEILRSAQKAVRSRDTKRELFRPMYSEEWFSEEKLRETLVAGGFASDDIVVHRVKTALAGDDLDGLVETMLLPFGKKMDGWTEEQRVALIANIEGGLSEEQKSSCCVDMHAFVAVALK
ncbi:S-adenosyl-L-methionine-dependent methyltransferase [Aspergillus pseudoustus]|uniref:S-adenosyl-L-methionine-dependent methyltransferase n=1 Tax=Aspergillus pseudoustus TaxID=1810923 RepID=A0ABR4JA62_9EURO